MNQMQQIQKTTLRVEGLNKAYPGVQALEDINLSFTPGEIHALAGQNGAGKSTLVKILSGAETQDSGELYLNGTAMRFHSPHDAQNAGIQTIYQELSLVPQLSVAENICLGNLPRRPGRGVDWGQMRETAVQALKRIGFELDVARPISSYSVAEQQAVELAKALQKKARVLLLDEPTSALPQPDVRRLFDVLQRLAEEGVALVYISHRMDEVFSICSDISVLRDGRHVATMRTADSKPSDVIHAMVGEKLEGSLAEAALSGAQSAKIGSNRSDEVLLSARDLSDGEKVEGISVDIHKGEVLGLSGLVGSGQSELARLLAGALTRQTGTIEIDGRKRGYRSPADAIKLGVGYLPQDRKEHGFVPEMSVAENMTLASLSGFSRYGFVAEGREKTQAQRLAKRLAMRISGIDQQMRTLSGGTQQKVILARWLVRSARLLICDEPTRGVDVEAKEEMYELLRDFARDGGTVLIASSEISEALMCDRVLVMARGRIVAEVAHADIDPEGKSIMAHFN